jgi:hypothetical protein
VKETDLVVATHGRSFWILDDLTPLHQMANGPLSADAHLFAPRRAVKWRAYKGHGSKPGPNREVAYRLAGSLGYGYRLIDTPTGEKKEQLLDAGENPPSGVILHYWLKEAPAGDLTLTFLDAAGGEIRSFTSKPVPAPAVSMVSPAPGAGEDASTPAVSDDEPRPTKDAGANRFVWDLRGPNATKLPDNKGRGGTIDSLTSPRVPPGRYQVRLSVGGTLDLTAHGGQMTTDLTAHGGQMRVLTQSFDVVKDPRVAATDAELGEQYTWARKAHDLLRRVHDAVLTIRDVRGQAEALAKRVDVPAVQDAARALGAAVSAVEAELITVRSDDPRMFPAKLNTRLAGVVTLVEYSDGAPTASLRDLCDNLALRTEMELAKLDRCLQDDVAAFNARCRDAGVATIIPKSGGPA